MEAKCVLCKEVMADERKVTLLCEHAAHAECLLKLVRVGKMQCPVKDCDASIFNVRGISGDFDASKKLPFTLEEFHSAAHFTLNRELGHNAPLCTYLKNSFFSLVEHGLKKNAWTFAFVCFPEISTDGLLAMVMLSRTLAERLQLRVRVDTEETNNVSTFDGTDVLITRERKRFEAFTGRLKFGFFNAV